MEDVLIRVAGKAGRITLNRPRALNAATYDMLRAIESAVDAWRGDDRVACVVIDAVGERAFCAGGDIAELYAAGRAGDFEFGRRFWRDEYRLNAKLATYPKPIVSLMQGFTMGGGVGLGCHARLRVVGDTSRIAMPECAIGLVPDVGGSLLLARAPGRLGEYLGLTGARMGPGAAIHAGFADRYLPEAEWPEAVAALEQTGEPTCLPERAAPAHDLPLEAIDRLFTPGSLGGILAALDADDSAFAEEARQGLMRNSPLSMACTLEILRRVRARPTIAEALKQEYRFTWRASEEGDFLEGIRAAIIDKDRRPRWRHGPTQVTEDDVARMLAPLGENDFEPEETT